MKTIKRPHLAGMSCFPSERVVKVVFKKRTSIINNNNDRFAYVFPAKELLKKVVEVVVKVVVFNIP